jgi:hypothetical protein
MLRRIPPYRADAVFLAAVATGFAFLAVQPDFLSRAFTEGVGAARVSPWHIIPLPLWMIMALVAGFGIPAAVIVRQRTSPPVVRAASAVMVSFVIQIGLEIAARKMGIVYAAPVIGAAFTSWRLRQLDRLRRTITPQDRLAHAMTIASAIFWSSNLIFLALTFVPRLLW